MAKDKNTNKEFYAFIEQMEDMIENMSDTERKQFWSLMSGETDLLQPSTAP